MSKAFVKEDGEKGDELELELDPLASLPEGAKNYMTVSGFQRLRDQLATLIHERSTQPSASLERRIQVLQRTLERSEAVDPTLQSGDRVLFGATVTVEDEEAGSRRYTIVGITEADASRGRISWHSPMGRGLLQSRAGDVVVIKTPQGEEELEVKKVEFLAVD